MKTQTHIDQIDHLDDLVGYQRLTVGVGHQRTADVIHHVHLTTAQTHVQHAAAVNFAVCNVIKNLRNKATKRTHCVATIIPENPGGRVPGSRKQSVSQH